MTCISQTYVPQELYQPFLFLTAINECTLALAREGATPCQNGGTCEDSVGTYYCHCAEGYTGTRCTEESEYTRLLL